VLEMQLAPNRDQWRMQSDGTYLKAVIAGSDRGAQQALLDWVSADRLAPSSIRRRRSPRRLVRRVERSTVV
jgi:hypothetical protein